MSEFTIRRMTIEMLEVFSPRVSGRCALVIIQPIAPLHPIIIPQRKNMNGITLSDIDEAVGDFIYFEDKYRFS